MEPENKDKIVEHLKQTLQAHIESNEKVYKWFVKIYDRLVKIMRRLFWVIIIAASSVFVSVMVVIYLQKQTEHKNQAAWDSINEANKYMVEQRKFIEYDRKDAATARAQNESTAASLNALAKRWDSLLNADYKGKKK